MIKENGSFQDIYIVQLSNDPCLVDQNYIIKCMNLKGKNLSRKPLSLIY
jgi:hypothetical protein